MGFFNTLNVSATGLSAQQLRMDILSQNIANVDTTKTERGTAYKRKVALFQERTSSPFGEHLNAAMKNNKANNAIFGNGVRVSRIVEDNSAGPKVYEPGHPDADKDGYIEKPNVNIVTEMVNMISASRSYEANITAMNLTKGMIAKTMEISK